MLEYTHIGNSEHCAWCVVAVSFRLKHTDEPCKLSESGIKPTLSLLKVVAAETGLGNIFLNRERFVRSMRDNYPARVKFYFAASRKLEQLVVLIRAGWVGLWLGLVDRGILHGIDEYCYDHWSEYHTEAHNRKGLTEWEKCAIRNYFENCRRLLVAGTGGGREMLALCRMGYEVDGFECHPQLAAFARSLIQKEGFTAHIDLVPRDECPQNERHYDGLIIGWGTYMLIQGRQKRVAFLRKMRAKVSAKAPLLVSFFHRQPEARRFKIITTVGNILRRILRKSLIEIGDSLAPNYVHLFTKAELAVELRQAGFNLVFYDIREYGHAVALAASDVCISIS